jgi:hypothetical protein
MRTMRFAVQMPSRYGYPVFVCLPFEDLCTIGIIESVDYTHGVNVAATIIIVVRVVDLLGGSRVVADY